MLPSEYLLNPKPARAFVYISTIQWMTINLFGRNAIFGIGDEEIDEDAGKLDIPIHAFDVIVADECHRGYTSAELSAWRNTLEHFDAIKIGLTATPAAHTTAYFREVVTRYDYETAVREGYLVDYDQVNLRSEVRMSGVFLQEGEGVVNVDPETGAEQMDLLEDERQFESEEVERKVTSPDSNRRILEEIRTYALAHEEEHGRFPKILIFADNDIPHTSHADSLVDIARDVFGQGDDFVQKITGRADRPLQKIREFRNRPNPKIVVTVDMLSTGVDIPDLEFIVFLRTVKSRILFEQMLGRGTRKGEQFPDKGKFTVFDCFDGTLFRYFKNATAITAHPPEKPYRTIIEIIEDVWSNRDRDYNTRCLVKRLQRIDKQMSGEAREAFARWLEDGDVGRFARELPGRLREDFTEAMGLLRAPAFQDLLMNYPRAKRTFVVAYESQDTVTSEVLIRDSGGREHRPEDYLAAFGRFVKEHAYDIEAIRILLNRPEEWSTDVLTELRNCLAKASEAFTVENLQKAHQMQYQKALVDIISMVKHAAREEEPLTTAPERVTRVFEQLRREQEFTDEQELWLSRIEGHLVENLSIDPEDFEELPILSRAGGWGRANRAFDGRLREIIKQINAEIAA